MNTFITPTWYLKDTALNFDDELGLLAQFDRAYNEAFANAPDGVKIGDTVGIRTQWFPTVSEGQALQQQGVFQGTVPISINHQFQVGTGWSSAQDRLEVEEVQDRYTGPTGRAIAGKWETVAGQEVYKAVPWFVGSPGVPITSNSTYTQAQALLRSIGTPAEFCAVLDPQSHADIANANIGLFNLGGQTKIFSNAQFANNRTFGIDDWYTSSLMPIHTTGTFTAATPTISGATQTGSTLTVTGMGTYAMKKGDQFTISGVYATNRVTQTTTRYLAQFALTADVSGTTTGTLSITPSIITSGGLQTVNASPANGAAISWQGATGTVSATMATQTSTQNLIFNPAAFGFVMVDLPENLAGAKASRWSNKKAKISMRYVEQYNIQTDQLPRRVDTIGGVAPILPVMAIRAWS